MMLVPILRVVIVALSECSMVSSGKVRLLILSSTCSIAMNDTYNTVLLLRIDRELGPSIFNILRLIYYILQNITVTVTIINT